MSEQKADLENYELGYSRYPLGLVLSSAFFAGLYGFFAFGYADDPETCLSSNKDDLISNFPMIDSSQTDAQGKVDVAARFRFFFLSAFYISIA